MSGTWSWTKQIGCWTWVSSLRNVFSHDAAFEPAVTGALKQCCGSGSESGSTGSTCFWACRIRILLWIWIRILLSSCENSKKYRDSYYFVTLFDFLSLKNDVNVASKSKKQKKLCQKICFLLASWRSVTKIAGSGSEVTYRVHRLLPMNTPSHYIWELAQIKIRSILDAIKPQRQMLMFSATWPEEVQVPMLFPHLDIQPQLR
jgi:hypothetical protein